VNARVPTTNISDVKLGNEVVGVKFELPLIENMSEVNRVKTSIQRAFDPTTIKAALTLANIASVLPWVMNRHLINWQNKDIDFIVSNVAGSRVPFQFCNKTVHSMNVFSAIMNPVPLMIIIHTYNNQTKIHINGEKNMKIKSKSLINTIKQNLEEEIEAH
jgi:hypothetical protein